LKSLIGPFRVAVPTVATVAATVADAVRAWPGAPIIVHRPEVKYDAFAASKVALAASGSVALELALAKLPMVVGYRLNPLTEAVLDRVLQVRQVNLVNLLLGRVLVCELLGRNCTPQRVAASVAELVQNERARAAHYEGYDEARRQLETGGVPPSLRAADQILDIIAARRRSDNHSLPMEDRSWR
jgi:lipid-A-disaccharide synthase